jgi:hypothetical protein
MSSLDEFRSSDTSRRLCAGLAEPDDGNSPAFPLVRAYVEPPAGIEPATHPLPSMRGRFTTPVQHLTCPRNRAGWRACHASSREARRGEARRGFWQISGPPCAHSHIDELEILDIRGSAHDGTA